MDHVRKTTKIRERILKELLKKMDVGEVHTLKNGVGGRVGGVCAWSNEKSSNRIKMSNRQSDRQETFPGDGNHDVHKITHSAESERFGPCGLSPY
jgi:hypothetical protein